MNDIADTPSTDQVTSASVGMFQPFGNVIKLSLRDDLKQHLYVLRLLITIEWMLPLSFLSISLVYLCVFGNYYFASVSY